jgi:hypothetical protein
LPLPLRLPPFQPLLLLELLPPLLLLLLLLQPLPLVLPLRLRLRLLLPLIQLQLPLRSLLFQLRLLRQSRPRLRHPLLLSPHL